MSVRKLGIKNVLEKSSLRWIRTLSPSDWRSFMSGRELAMQLPLYTTVTNRRTKLKFIFELNLKKMNFKFYFDVVLKSLCGLNWTLFYKIKYGLRLSRWVLLFYIISWNSPALSLFPAKISQWDCCSSVFTINRTESSNQRIWTLVIIIIRTAFKGFQQNVIFFKLYQNQSNENESRMILIIVIYLLHHSLLPLI